MSELCKWFFIYLNLVFLGTFIHHTQLYKKMFLQIQLKSQKLKIDFSDLSY